jgi:gas vesicle protein
MKDSTKRFAVGTALAAAAGFLTGILTAPKSGKETRKDIKEAAVSSINEAERQLKRLHTELNDVIAQAKDHGDRVSGKTKEELNVAVQATRQVKEMVREILSAVHEGRAEDKELQKAIADAQKAVKHLRSYIKKRNG